METVKQRITRMIFWIKNKTGQLEIEFNSLREYNEGLQKISLNDQI